MSELKPCPFCAGPAECRPDEVGSGGQHVRPYHAGCRSCGVYFTEDEQAEAIAVWNYRALAPADGWVSVPREPTQRMIRAAWECKNAGPITIYKAMIAAAPTEPIAPADAEEPKENYVPFLDNYADGCDGHYCIARRHPDGYYEFYNKGKWVSAAQVFILEAAPTEGARE